ncbi:putative Zuotin [Leucosporidium creatinivorum]|uniref:Putative Zuotin n=1 Tax=Leucosporidium creatinivorum TaxID=106004 RepID=A0A1Y2G0E4_9BASI|nr:putative Zuotin [Leucosporidium creatinivorum]
MSTTIQSSLALPSPPKGYKAPAFSPLSAPSTSTLFPAGPAFLSHARRVLNQRSFEEDDRLLAEERAKNGGDVVEEDDADAGLGDEQEEKSLLQQDPKLWKEQDHYAVLGLQSLRYKATQEQIKKAHRRKVLRHHPDKKASGGGDANDDSFFKCIAKAMETLSHPEKRRQFDSVDEAVDDSVPEAKETNAENFFDLWAPVFEREGRFSVKQPVPSLGDKETSKKDTEAFYDFWYNIDSWRSFEYLDKDVAEGADSRDEKRHQEKKNKSERAKKKKEDIAATREMVDLALSLDPRIKAFKAAEKAARAAKKGGPAVVDTKKLEEEKKAAEEAAAAKAAEEQKQAADDKATREAAKKAREAAKKNVKKDKKAITALVTSNNYFVAAGSAPSASVVEGQFTELDVIFEKLEPEQIGELKKQAEAAKGPDAIKAVIAEFAKKVEGGNFVQFA